MTICHISFDVWNTLVKPNKRFAEERTKLISDLTNCSVEHVKHVYTQTKTFVDQIAEHNNFPNALPSLEVYQLLLDNLNSATPVDPRIVQFKVNFLFRKHSPLIEQSVRDAIEYCYNNNISMSIASNSNFISGNEMHPWLQREFSNKFPIGLYSDAFSIAKPNQRFFSKLLPYVQYKNMLPSQVLHIGDNKICDGIGPQSVGFQSMVIAGPDQLFTTIKHVVGEQNG